jgi:phage repressor protein C with HTH and peptisase S24 domain
MRKRIFFRMSNKELLVRKNLEWLIERAGTNPHVLKEKTGVPQPTIHRILTGESTDPRTSTLQPLADHFGVTVADLRDRDLSASADPLPPGARRVHAADAHDPSLTQIMKVTLKVQAGITGFTVEPEYHDGRTMGVPTEWVRNERFVAGDLLAITVRGESMEPSLFDGDVIVVNTGDKTLVDGAVYAVNYEGEVVVKRMMRDAGMWWLTSDNLDQRKYHRKSCKGAECIVIGRVVRKESTHI